MLTEPITRYMQFPFHHGYLRILTSTSNRPDAQIDSVLVAGYFEAVQEMRGSLDHIPIPRRAEGVCGLESGDQSMDGWYERKSTPGGDGSFRSRQWQVERS